MRTMTTSLRSRVRRICPKPHKHRFATEQAALTAAGRRAFAVGKPYYARACRCGRWHVASKARRP